MEALIAGYVVESMTAASALFFTVAALAAGALAVYLYVPWWRVRGVPGPPAFPLVGHIPLLAKHGPDVFAVLAKRYGPIYRFHMGRQPLIIVTDPELCREVGIKKFKSIPNRSVPSALASSPIHLKGLFLTRGSRWQSMRNVIISIYQPSHLAGLVPAIQPYLDRAARLLRPGEEDGVAFSDIALRLFTDTIGQVAFGVDFGLTGADRSTASAPEDAAADDFIRKHLYSTTSLKMDLSGSLSIMLGQLVPFLQRPARALLLRVPGTADRLIRDTNEAISERLDEIVAARAAREERGQKDFLSVVLSASEGGEEMRRLLTPDYVSALTFEHLLAGSTTMSFTLSSLLYLVAMHPEVEEKLLQEVDAFGPKDVVPTAEELQTKFPYLEQVLKETMRFFMVSPLIARETSENVEIGGCAIPKGTWVWLAPGVMAMDPAHFPEPEAFRPERFDPGSEGCRRRHPYAFIPFGIGPRVCIGQKFSVQQLKLAAVHLYRRFVFRHSPEMEHPLQFQYGIVVNFKHGVKLQVVGRQAS